MDSKKKNGNDQLIDGTMTTMEPTAYPFFFFFWLFGKYINILNFFFISQSMNLLVCFLHEQALIQQFKNSRFVSICLSILLIFHPSLSINSFCCCSCCCSCCFLFLLCTGGKISFVIPEAQSAVCCVYFSSFNCFTRFL